MSILSRQEFVSKVKNIILEEIGDIRFSTSKGIDIRTLLPSKMLRTHLGASLSSLCTTAESVDKLLTACAATEIIHTASLCHDDVIDGGMIRRGSPTLWRATGQTGAVLIGDHLMCNAVDLMLRTEDVHLTSVFVNKVKEMCTVEIEHELSYLGKIIDEDTCLRIARGKTGTLFGFIGYAAGGSDHALSLALEEVGYRIGSAYQFFDDLLDIEGDEKETGKTLGLDIKRGKYTLPNSSGLSHEHVRDRINALCSTALDSIARWPEAVKALEEYITEDFQTIVNGLTNCKIIMFS